MHLRRGTRGLRLDSGQTLAEFAVAAPILFILIFGLVDVARMYHAYVTVQGAARDAARYGVTGRSDCAGATTRQNCIVEVAHTSASGLSNSASAVTVSESSWQYPSYTVANAAGDPGGQCDLLQVKVQYDFKPATPLLSRIIGAIHISGQEKMVNEPFGPCDAS
jgi:Flp pilus assembly protein TadG